MKNLEKSGNSKEASESQGKVSEFCCLKFIFSQVDGSNFENFLEPYQQIIDRVC